MPSVLDKNKYNIMSKIIKLFILSLLIFSSSSMFAATEPGWSYDPNAYEFDMTMYVALHQRGEDIRSWDDVRLGAFCGEECRGVAVVETVSGVDVKYYYLRVRSNTASGETITFKSYDTRSGEETDLEESLTFQHSNRHGYPSNPFVLTLPFTAVTGVTLDKTALSLTVGQTQTLEATVNPADATIKTVVWTSSNPTVASVDQTGKLTALKAGTTTIIVTTDDGGFTAQCTLTVIQPVTGVSLDKITLTLGVDSIAVLIATVAPADASNKKMSWKSSDQTIVKVDPNGQLTGLKTGEATVTVTTEDGGFTASCVITVVQRVTGVQLDRTELTLYVDSIETLIATVLPAEATNKKVNWSSSIPSIVSVDANGQVRALKAGAAVVMVTTEEGNFYAECPVHVLQHVNGVELDQPELTIPVGEEVTLLPIISPEDATEKGVTWRSSEEKVATVDENGKVTGIGPGNATITVTTVDGFHEAECSVFVFIPVTGVELNHDTYSLYIEETLQLTATVLPADATFKEISWSSSDESVAGVDSEGLVTALKPGNVVITVKTTDGGYEAYCEIKVVPSVNIRNEDLNKLVIYPIAIREKCKIENLPFQSKIFILNLKGKILIQLANDNAANIEVDFTSIPNGIYFLKILSKNKFITKKIVKY